MDQTEKDLKQIVIVTLLMIFICFQSALWFKMDAMRIHLKYMEEKVENLAQGYIPADYPTSSEDMYEGE